MSMAILIAHDDGDVRRYLASQLKADGQRAYQTDARDHTIAVLVEHSIDVLVLGKLSQAFPALELLRELRDESLAAAVDPRLPVLTLGGTSHLDVLRAYEAGSDHHLPSSVDYLILRAVVEAVRRRSELAGQSPRVQRIAGLEIDAARRRVAVDEQPIALSATEFTLLRTLASDPSRVFTKDELLRDVWGFRSPGRTRTLDSHACRLRAKLRRGGHQFIVNVWGVGYRLLDS